MIYLDNGPANGGRRRRFLQRLVEFADWSGLVVRLVYDPPYHSKYNPIERCWSALERTWNGVLLNSWAVILSWAGRMWWCGRHPVVVARLAGPYAAAAAVPAAEMAGVTGRLERSAELPKYDITIRPKRPRGGET